MPWFLGYFLYQKDKKLVLTVAPIAAVISHVINALGIHFDLWHFQPFSLEALATLPLNLGYFSLAGCCIVYLMLNLKSNPYLILLFACITMTFLEYLAISGGILVYSNGWNYFFTIISYYVAYILTYWYYVFHDAIVRKPPTSTS